MANPVTDPELLAQLNAPEPGRRVTDPALLAALNGDAHPLVEAHIHMTADAPPAAVAAPEPKSTLQTIREALHAPTRALENGIFLGLGDRARAGIDSILSAGGYSQHLKDEQGDTAQFASDHPIAAPVLEGVGGMVAPVGAFAAASKAVGLGTKIAYGAGAGGTIGGLQGAFSSKDWTDLPQVAKDTAMGAGTGAALGGAIPVVGKVAGAAYNAAANAVRGKVDGMSRAASGHLINAMQADGPAAVRQRMAELGPDAMLADAGPAFLGKAQGASLNSDEGRSVLQSALATRNEGTNARIMGDVNRVLGPAEDPQSVTNAITAHRSKVDASSYPAALDDAPSVEIAPIMRDLVDRIEQTPVGSMEHKALTNLQTMLTKTKKEPMLDAGGYPVYDQFGNERWKDVPYSHDDANVLHKVKGEIDNVISYDAPGLGVPAGALSRQQGALKQMRGAINDALETQVPGYKSANEASAALAKRAEAVQAGTQYLGSGKTTPSPQRFATEFRELSPDEMIAFSKGSRGEIERVLGTKANDLQALRTELQGEGGWNAAKLATVHGQPAADELAGSVDRNLKFRDTHQKVVEGSQTDIRNAARKEMKPDPSTETPFINSGSTMTGMVATVGKKALNAAYGAVRPDPTRSFGEVARALTEQGTARDARLTAIIDALDKRKGNALVAGRAGDTAALLSAIAANGYAQSRRK